MLVQTSYLYIRIGLAIRLLRNVTEEYTKEFTSSALDALHEELQAGNFQVTLSAMEEGQFQEMLSNLNALPSNDAPRRGTCEIGKFSSSQSRNRYLC